MAARAASRIVAAAPTAVRNRALLAVHDALDGARASLAEANRQDLEQGRANALEAPLLDRLELTPSRIDTMLEGLRQVVALPDPVGSISEMRSMPSGIQVGRMRVPLGVIGIIYESRPNVTVEAASLCLKAGNATILRGGSEALASNCAIAECLRQGLQASGLPAAAVQVVATADRAAVGQLITMPEYVDVIVPRGGKGLIERISRDARVPVIKHLDGVCHVYIDDYADDEMAVSIAFNAKTQRYGTCNTMETLLVAASKAQALLPRLAQAYAEAGVELRYCRLPQRPPSRIGARSIWHPFSRCVWWMAWSRRLSISIPTVHNTPTALSRRSMPGPCASCGKWIPARSWSMPRRGWQTGSSTVWVPKSVFPPTNCTPAAPWGWKGLPHRSLSCSGRGSFALERARIVHAGTGRSLRRHVQSSALRPPAFRARVGGAVATGTIAPDAQCATTAP